MIATTRTLALAALVGASLAAGGPAWAQASVPQATTPAPIEVTGFRSAKFGMNEQEVRNAAAKDFNVKPAALKAQDNEIEQTHVLTIPVPDLLPSGGTAEVSYVLGYKTKKLIQIGVAWSKAIDEKMTPERLFSNANVLRANFLAANYRPDSIATNTPVANGLLMFRGNDAQNSLVNKTTMTCRIAEGGGGRPHCRVSLSGT